LLAGLGCRPALITCWDCGFESCLGMDIACDCCVLCR